MQFFDSWRSLGFTALSGIVAYGALILFLRISGKRTLAKMNAFDFVVTVALGSILGSVLTAQQLPLANGLLALGLLIVLQYTVAWLTVRAPWFRRVISSEPHLLFRDGEFMEGPLRRARLNQGEIIAAIRKEGFDDLSDVAAVILETDGSFSVLRASPESPRRPTLENVGPQ